MARTWRVVCHAETESETLQAPPFLARHAFIEFIISDLNEEENSCDGVLW